MASKASQTNLSEQGKLLFAELGRDFLERLYMTGKRWEKKAKPVEILTYLTPGKPNIIKRDLSQLQGRWRRLKLQSKKDHDLHSREK